MTQIWKASSQWFVQCVTCGGLDKHLPTCAAFEYRDLYDLLVRVSEYLDDRADVRDGEDGPLPNRAMSLGQEVDAALEKLRPVSK